jgi:hypothetical protein
LGCKIAIIGNQFQQFSLTLQLYYSQNINKTSKPKQYDKEIYYHLNDSVRLNNDDGTGSLHRV